MNVHICESCGKEHDGSYASGRFCSSSCSRTYSSRIRRAEINKKVSEKQKHFTCEQCGNVFTAHYSKRRLICPSCGQSTIDEKKKCKICGQVDCVDRLHRNNFKTLLQLFHQINFCDESKIGTVDACKEVEKLKKRLYKDYWEDGLSMQDMHLKYKYGHSGDNFYVVFKALDIPIRSASQSTRNAFKRGKYISKDAYGGFKTYHHKSWEGNYYTMRSTNEVIQAKLMDQAKISYQYESLAIPYFDSQMNKERTAIPDFYIPSENKIIEIKSSYTFHIKNVKDKFKKYQELGYQTELILDFEKVNPFDFEDDDKRFGKYHRLVLEGKEIDDITKIDTYVEEIKKHGKIISKPKRSQSDILKEYWAKQREMGKSSHLKGTKRSEEAKRKTSESLKRYYRMKRLNQLKYI